MLQGKVIVITGATRGIGRAVSQSFAREGAKVVLVGKDAGRLQRVQAEVARIDPEVIAIKADVREESEVCRMVDRVMDQFGRIDILINNAGVVTHFTWATNWSPICDMDKAFWDRVIETNLGGTFLCTKHVLPHMETRGVGHVVNLHGGGNVRTPGGCAYVVSKEAIRTFTRYVAEEEREWNICIVAVSPGGIIATEDAPEEFRQRLRGAESMGSWFVLAAEAGMEFTGHLLTVEDGHLAIRD